MINKIRVKMDKIDKNLSSLEGFIKNNIILTGILDFVLLYIPIILYKINILNFEYMISTLIGIIIIIIFIEGTDRIRDLSFGIFGVLTVTIVLYAMIFSYKPLLEYKSILLCILTSCLLLHDSIREKRDYKKNNNTQAFRLLLTIILLIIIGINEFVDFSGVIDLWSVGMMFIYFIPLIYTPKEKD